MTSTDYYGDKWEIYQSKENWRWRRTARNGEIVGASTQGYSNKSDCIANAERNGMGHTSCPFQDTYGDKWELYKSGTDWRWRRTSRNGNIVGASTQGYSSKAGCVANAERHGMPSALQGCA